MNKADLSVGQEVLLFSRYGRRDAEPKRGRITKIGRTLVTITDDDSRYPTEQKYRIADGGMPGDFGSSMWFRTAEAFAEDERMKVCWEILRKKGISLGLGRNDLSADQIERITAIVCEAI